MTFYRLEGHEPIPMADVMAWAEWFTKTDRTVRREVVDPGVVVSTVFLGIDHSFGTGDGPVLFETLIMHESLTGRLPRRMRALLGQQWRYRTWTAAVAGHQAAVSLVVLAAQRPRRRPH